MIVKVCGITSLEDAQMAVDAGASALGFNFYGDSPRYLQPQEAGRIGRALPAGVLKVGIFVNETAAAVHEIATAAGLDVVQLYGTSTAEGWRVWRACRVDAQFSEAALDDAAAEAFLLDTPGDLHGGSGRTFDWTAARGLKRRIILAGGLDATNVRAAIAAVQPWGVDACSRLESSPGRKDAGKVRQFVKAALNL